jgi:hypothetical protein
MTHLYSPAISIYTDSMIGTPKTLQEAIKNGLDAGKVSYSPEAIQVLSAHVQDYLAQKFGVLMLDANNTTLKVLKTLWDRILVK